MAPQLKLIALDADDLAVISAHVQDARLQACDIVWRQSEKRLVIGMNRLDWDQSLDGATEPRRLLSALRFDRVLACKSRKIDLDAPTAVLERVKRLTRDGYILGYEARLNPAKLGAGLLVFVEILLDRTVHDVMDNFKAAVQVRPEILECHLVAGGFDYLLKTRVANMTAYREFIGSVIWTLPGVRETRTYAVMEEVKNTTALAL